MQKKNFKFSYLVLAFVGLTANAMDPALAKTIAPKTFACQVGTATGSFTRFSLPGRALLNLEQAKVMIKQKARVNAINMFSVGSKTIVTQEDWEKALQDATSQTTPTLDIYIK